MIPTTDGKQAFTSFCLAATCLIESLSYQPSACWASTGFDPNTHRLKACARGANCVSSNYAEPPNVYVSPFRTKTNDRSTAFQRALEDVSLSGADDSGGLAGRLSGVRVAEVIPQDFYIHLTTPGTAPGSLDDLELIFPADGDIVNIRCEARVTLPPPPFCIRKNCINGNIDQRRRVEELGLGIGLPPADEREMKEEAKWTPIFFNSDRVPGM